MAEFDLSKGDTFDLTKAAPATTSFYAGLGWADQQGYDLDISIFPCKYNSAGDPELLSPPYFIFYNNLKSPCGGIVRSPDNRDGSDTLSPTGKPTKDDEWAQLHLALLDPQIQELAFIVTIHDAGPKNQSFNKIADSYVRICEMDSTGEPTREILKYRLDEDAGDAWAVQFGSLVRMPDGHWDFQAVGQGFKADLGTIIKSYMPGATIKN